MHSKRSLDRGLYRATFTAPTRGARIAAPFAPSAALVAAACGIVII
ncbi:hypothetical protein [Desulfocurvus sp. DL9XJH121]